MTATINYHYKTGNWNISCNRDAFPEPEKIDAQGPGKWPWMGEIDRDNLEYHFYTTCAGDASISLQILNEDTTKNDFVMSEWSEFRSVVAAITKSEDGYVAASKAIPE